MLKSRVWQERMNPLSLDHSRFLIAESEQGGELLGFGQLQQLADANGGAPAAYELRSLVVLPQSRLACMCCVCV